MRILFYVIPAVAFLPISIYGYIFLRRFLTLFHIKPGTWCSRGLSFLAVPLIGFAFWPIYGLGAVLVLHFLVVCLVMEILNAVLTKRILKNECRIWRFLYKSGSVAVIVVAGICLYGYQNIHQIHETNYAVNSQKIPEGDSLRIAAITDLHLGTTMDADQLKGWCSAIEVRKPDVLVLAGDIFDESTPRGEMQKGAEVFGNVKTKYGTYYVFGNHDSNKATSAPLYTKEELRESLEESHVHVLEDEVVQLNENYILIGRQDASSKSREETSSLVEGIDPSAFTILLDHQPVGLKENDRQGIDLQISGHTHSGQIWPTGTLMKLFHLNEWNYGYLQEGGLQLIVSSGIGGWGYPIRTGGHSEYVIIDLETSK